MPSFDIVSKVDEQELSNAVIQARKEIATRFDFKGSKSDIILEKTEIKLITEDDMKLRSITDILNSKLIKRGISTKNMRYGKLEEVGGKMKQQKIAIKQGVEREEAKKIIQVIKESELKVQSQIMDDLVRVTGKKIDDLQDVIQMLRANEEIPIALQFVNMRS